MTTLHLGVTDLPYSSQNLGMSSTGKARASTTGDVAEILEGKYHIFQHFYDKHQAEIVDHLKDSIEGAFESVMMGARPVADPHAAGGEEIEQMFRTFLSQREMDGIVPGVPTQASLKGVSRRFKKASKRRASRPSFVDTGLYESSMKAWVD